MKFASFMPQVANFDDVVRANAIQVAKTSDGLTLKHLSPYSGENAIQMLHADLFKPRTKYVILYSPLKGLLCFEHNWLFKSKSNWPSLRDTHYAIEVVANLYYHDSVENSILFVNTQPVVSDPDITFYQPEKSPIRVHDFIASQFPADEDVVAHNTNLRFEKLTELSDIDSIVALEQQVDLLTSLVKALMSGAPAPEWAETFLGAVQSHSTETVKPAASLIDDLAAHKARVRKAQTEYLSNRK